MIKRKDREQTEINASSMADIAFLLLIFFLVTTTIASDKGVTMMLPPDVPAPPVDIPRRNVLEISINSADKLLVEGEPMEASELPELTRTFLTNNGKDKDLSDNPNKAIVSIKADRGTTYEAYMGVLDGVKYVYYDLRAESVGISYAEYLDILNTRKSDRTKSQQKLYEDAKANYPLQISEAEPSGN